MICELCQTLVQAPEAPEDEAAPTVLIVDDDANSRLILEDLLAPLGYRLITAADGPAALDRAIRHLPDLILLDVMLPGLDGREVCRRLRATPTLAEVPILLITACSDQRDRLDGLAAGADDFITKPFNAAELTARIRTITRLNRYRLLHNARRRSIEVAWVAARKIADTFEQTLRGWVKALELRDEETEAHSRRVTGLTLDLARGYGFSDDELVNIGRGALLHDIGKLGVSDTILLKPGALDRGERAAIERHPVYAYEWLAPIEFLQPALDIPYAHHERWDGSGYPRGLRGEAIPLPARIFAVVDVWDALTTDRPYRRAFSGAEARAIIARGAGSHFDPEVAARFLATVGAEHAYAA